MIGLGSDKYEIVIELGDDNDHCGYMDDDGHDRDDSHCGLILNTKDIHMSHHVQCSGVPASGCMYTTRDTNNDSNEFLGRPLRFLKYLSMFQWGKICHT